MQNLFEKCIQIRKKYTRLIQDKAAEKELGVKGKLITAESYLSWLEGL